MIGYNNALHDDFVATYLCTTNILVFFCIYMFILSSLALYVLILNIDIYRTHHSLKHRVEIFDS